jgi:hypothetical protein
MQDAHYVDSKSVFVVRASVLSPSSPGERAPELRWTMPAPNAVPQPRWIPSERMEAKRQFSTVAQMVDFGLRRSKTLYLSMEVD